MSGDDWAPGDLALCVAQYGWSDRSGEVDFIGPALGSIHCVAQVYVREASVFLMFRPWPTTGFLSTAFIKLREHELDADDAEVIAALTGDSVILIPAKPRRRVGEQVPQ